MQPGMVSAMWSDSAMLAPISIERLLPGLNATVVRPECCYSSIAQSDHIALTIPGCIDDALGNYFVNDWWLPGIAELFAGTVECLADNLRNAVVEDDPGSSDEWQNRCHAVSPTARNLRVVRIVSTS